MNKLSLAKVLIIATIILIGSFQCYWLTILYQQERESLKRETDLLFRDVVYKLQLQRFKKDSAFFNLGKPDNLFAVDLVNAVRQGSVDSILFKNFEKDSVRRRVMVTVQSQDFHDNNLRYTDAGLLPPAGVGGPPTMFSHSSNGKNVNDSLPLQLIDSAYKAELLRNNISLGYALHYISGKAAINKLPRVKPGELKTNFTFVGLSRSYAYQAAFSSPVSYLLRQLTYPIIVSILLIGFTILSFVFLYRNLLAQQRLSLVKNEFISNITHELKTPIATVNVAIEALRNFNALHDPLKTKEYLDISASELQRLSLLVDKVLRLSMFESDAVELHKEQFDLSSLITEVLKIMQLQIERQHAVVTLTTTGENFVIDADRMHITSVLYNLLDNALKYKREQPLIDISLQSHRMHVELKVKDNGIGIPPEYRRKVFEKLFRVPTDDVHNAKGYGLGLSYVNHIIQKHMGFIDVESEPGKGSVFTVLIPYKEMDTIWFDDKRSIRKIAIGLPANRKL